MQMKKQTNQLIPFVMCKQRWEHEMSAHNKIIKIPIINLRLHSVFSTLFKIVLTKRIWGMKRSI